MENKGRKRGEGGRKAKNEGEAAHPQKFSKVITCVLSSSKNYLFGYLEGGGGSRHFFLDIPPLGHFPRLRQLKRGILAHDINLGLLLPISEKGRSPY